VSVAAQLATFPLGVLYFHRFPVYFLLANLFVIPGAFGVMALGVLFFILAPFEPAATLLAQALDFLIASMNSIVFFIEKLPASTMDQLWMDPTQTWLLYLLLFSLFSTLLSRKVQWLHASLALAFLWATYSSVLWIDRVHSSRLVLYQVAGSGYLDHIASGFFTPRLHSGWQKDNNADYQTLGNRIRYAPFGESQYPQPHQELMIWEGKTFLFIESDSLPIPIAFETDYLVVGGNRISSLQQLPEQLKFHTLVIDGSNSRRTADRLREEAKTAGTRHHSIIHHGALILEKNADKDRN
jgi:competence protein ComEC